MTGDPARQRAFSLGLLAGGVYLAPSHPGFTSAAHSEADVEHVLEVSERVLGRDRRGGVSAALAALLEREQAAFRERTPGSRSLHEQAKGSLLHGVPMHWMAEWASPYPLFVAAAEGARLTDVDGNLVRRLLPRRHRRDGGALAGADGGGSRAAGRARNHRDAPLGGFRRGSRRSSPGVSASPSWQFALTATDANRFAIRLARELTGRSKVLVFNWCYHGSVDEALAVLEGSRAVPRPGNVGPPLDPELTTRVVEWNDVDALERALAEEDVACVLAEPALTNIGIVLPEPGFHEVLRELTRRTGTLLAIDETHTICCGPGATRARTHSSPTS